MGIHTKTANLIQSASAILTDPNRPMTVRQIYYQLVARHIIENSKASYQRLSSALVKARKNKDIPWDWIEDRLREPRTPRMFRDLSHFLDAVRHSYRRDTWEDQDYYVEVWEEKDALSGVFQPIVWEYGVTLLVGRGYTSPSCQHEASFRFPEDTKNVILYFGDFDPSGLDIPRALQDGLDEFGVSVKVELIALTRQDIETYDLPPDVTKKGDRRTKKFVEKYGDMAVELDALPRQVLEGRIRSSIERYLDKSQILKVREIEKKEIAELKALVDGRGRS